MAFCFGLFFCFVFRRKNRLAKAARARRNRNRLAALRAIEAGGVDLVALQLAQQPRGFGAQEREENRGDAGERKRGAEENDEGIVSARRPAPLRSRLVLRFVL